MILLQILDNKEDINIIVLKLLINAVIIILFSIISINQYTKMFISIRFNISLEHISACNFIEKYCVMQLLLATNVLTNSVCII